MDLSALAGEPTVYIQFRLRSNANTQRDGWWVDDIVVQGLVDGGTTATEPPAAAPAPSLALAPNPASVGVDLTYTLGAATAVRLEVVDALGRLVATIADGMRPAGRHSVRWDGRTHAGAAAPGVYLVRLEAAGSVVTRRLTLGR
jgi:hypothetical protein